MRRLAITVFGVLSFMLLSAASALAQSNIPPDEVGGEVVVPPGAGPGATAFTGTNVTVWMVMVVVLLIAGVALLLAARRRARTVRA
jgi:LPXTG-motif cell wall-anchored protein